MKILFALTYYKPYISGLTIYVQRLAEELKVLGNEVTVVTSQYDKDLNSEETLNGVNIVRVPVQFWISKGAIMLNYWKKVFKLIEKNEIAVINFPNTFIETFTLVLYAKLLKRPLVGIYHCDVELPQTFFNSIVNFVVYMVNMIGALFVDVMITNTEDFAKVSNVLRHFLNKIIIIPPPILISLPDKDKVNLYKNLFGGNDEQIIGFLGRISAEKGVHLLIESLPLILEKYPNTKMVFAGEFKKVIGEQKYFKKIQSLIHLYDKYIIFLGSLASDQISNFLKSCDVLVLPSTNNTETFGIVQVESMLCGTPVVASNLPGVRVPISTTGMGILVEPGNPKALSEAITSILSSKNTYIKNRDDIEKHFSLKITVESYIQVFKKLLNHQSNVCTQKLSGDKEKRREPTK